MVGVADEELDEVGHGQANEGDRAAEGGDGAGEDARGEDDPEAGAVEACADGAGVVITEEPGVEGFGGAHGGYSAGEENQGENGNLGPVEAAHGAEGPDEVGLKLFGAADILEHLDDGGGTCADHDADDEEGGVVMKTGGYGEHDEEHDGAACAGGDGHNPGAGDAEEGNAGGVSHEYERYRKTGARGETEHIGAGEGVAKKGLHLEAGEREGAAGETTGNSLGHAEIPNDVFPDGVGGLAAGQYS